MYILKIKIESFKNIFNLINILNQIKFFLKEKNIQIKQNFKPKKNNIYTILRSPHVNKKSREHFNFQKFNYNFQIIHENIFIILNFLILIKKILPSNIQIYTKILKN